MQIIFDNDPKQSDKVQRARNEGKFLERYADGWIVYETV